MTPTAPSEPPGECAIKGNINRDNERICHVAGGRFYDRTGISPERSERWFCTEGGAGRRLAALKAVGGAQGGRSDHLCPRPFVDVYFREVT